MPAMRIEEVEAQATRLYEMLGPRAIATAAQRAAQAEKEGDGQTAHDWRLVEERLKERRGPRQS